MLDLARAHGVDVPITEAVVRVCHEGESPAQMVKEIMSRARPKAGVTRPTWGDGTRSVRGG